MKEEFVIIDMSTVEPSITIATHTDIKSHYVIKRDQCTKEYIQKHIIEQYPIQYIVYITPEQEQCKDIFSRWEDVLQVPLSPQECLSRCGQYMISEGISIPIYSIDKGSAVILGLALDKEYQAISMRTGIILIYAGNYRTAIISMYRGSLYGTFGFCSALIEKEEVAYALEQFKHRWLPEEEIQDMGGCGSIFVPHIPEEAVFSATYCIGMKVKKYEQIATCIPYTKCEDYILKSTRELFLQRKQ